MTSQNPNAIQDSHPVTALGKEAPSTELQCQLTSWSPSSPWLLLPGGHHSEGHPTRGSVGCRFVADVPGQEGEHHMAQDAHADSILGAGLFFGETNPTTAH